MIIIVRVRKDTAGMRLFLNSESRRIDKVYGLFVAQVN